SLPSAPRAARRVLATRADGARGPRDAAPLRRAGGQGRGPDAARGDGPLPCLRTRSRCAVAALEPPRYPARLRVGRHAARARGATSIAPLPRAAPGAIDRPSPGHAHGFLLQGAVGEE